MKDLLKCASYVLVAIYAGVCIILLSGTDVAYECGESALPWYNLIGVAMLMVGAFLLNLYNGRKVS